MQILHLDGIRDMHFVVWYPKRGLSILYRARASALSSGDNVITYVEPSVSGDRGGTRNIEVFSITRDIEIEYLHGRVTGRGPCMVGRRDYFVTSIGLRGLYYGQCSRICQRRHP
jgi:hypothetical protein